MTQVCTLLGIRKTRTTAYHPQGDGLVERFNRTLLSMLATSTQQHPTLWDAYLPKLCFAYNTSEHPTTGYMPFFLMFGREACLPVDLMYGPSPSQPHPSSHYAADVQSQLNTAYQNVRNNMEAAHKRQKELYDRRVHGEPYSVGEFVWLHRPQVPLGHSRKLYSPWDGPYLVLNRISDVTYQISRVTGRPTTFVVHFDRLKPCPADVRLPPSDSHFPPPSHHVGEGLILTQHELDTPPVAVYPPPQAAVVPASQPHTQRYPSRNRQAPDRYSYNV
jgi:hypothetical protein